MDCTPYIEARLWLDVAFAFGVVMAAVIITLDGLRRYWRAEAEACRDALYACYLRNDEAAKALAAGGVSAGETWGPEALKRLGLQPAPSAMPDAGGAAS